MMFKKLKQLFKNISYLYNNDLAKVENLQDLEAKNIKFECNYLIRKLKTDIDKQFNIDLDVNYKPNTNANVIVTGIYKGEEYIKLYELNSRDFNDLVKQLKSREKFGEIRNIDAIGGFPKKEFKARFNYAL